MDPIVRVRVTASLYPDARTDWNELCIESISSSLPGRLAFPNEIRSETSDSVASSVSAEENMVRYGVLNIPFPAQSSPLTPNIYRTFFSPHLPRLAFLSPRLKSRPCGELSATSATSTCHSRRSWGTISTTSSQSSRDGTGLSHRVLPIRPRCGAVCWMITCRRSSRSRSRQKAALCDHSCDRQVSLIGQHPSAP